MQVYVWNVSSYFSLSEEDEIWEKSLALIDKERRTKLEKYRNPKDRARSLAAGLLLRYGFLQYRKQDENPGINTQYDLTCGQGAHEKPYFLHYPKVQFNLSHSGDYIALVIGEEQCGIDVQEPRRLSDGFRREFYHEQEKEWLENHPEDDIRLFSLKEAVMKFTGEGLSKGMNHFSVIPLLLKQEVREMNQCIWGESICLPNHYALSVVTSGEKDKCLLERAVYLEGFLKLPLPY